MNKEGFSMFACALGILLISMGILLARSFFVKAQSYFGPLGKGATSVSIMPETEAGTGISAKDIEKLEKQLGVPVAYSAVARMALSSESESAGEGTATADVYGVGGEFFQFHHFAFVHGTSFADGLEYDPVIIMDDVTAWNLFGAVEVSGMKLEIEDTEFTVTGVFESDRSLIAEVSSSEIRRVYIPLGALEQMRDTIRIRNLEASFDDATLPEERAEAMNEALALVGKSEQDFRLIDYRVKDALMPQWQDVLAFIAGLIALVRLGARIWGYSLPRVRALGTRAALSPKKLRKFRNKQLTEIACAALVLGAAIAVVLLLSEWTLYIPSKYMPAELIDVKFFYNLFVGNFRDSLGAGGYLPMWWETAYEAASRCVSTLTLWGLFGFAVATPSLALIGRKSRDRSIRALQATLYALLMMALSVAVAAILGLDPVFELKHMALISLYCFSGVLLIRPRREDIPYDADAIDEIALENAQDGEAASKATIVSAGLPEAIAETKRDANDAPEATNVDGEQGGTQSVTNLTDERIQNHDHS